MNGLLNVYKPSGMTSHDVVQHIRRQLKIKQVGHLGTLDPLAEGVLVVAVGSATKLIPFLEDSSKSYVAEVIFGFSTTTYDLEGDITAQNDEFIFNKEDFDSALNDFLGDIDQIPPIYSAIKVNGRKLYDYARSNQTVEIPSRKVRINKLERVSDYYEDDYKKVKIEADVSKGTYIRSLCKDIGERLGVPTCMGKLIRTRCGNHCIENAINLNETDLEKYIITPLAALSHLPSIDIENNEDLIKKVNNGMKLSPHVLDVEAELLVVKCGNSLKAIYKFNSEDIKGYQAVRVWN